MSRLVLFHAATRDRHDFPMLLDALPEEIARRACPVDLPGHGEGPRLPRYRLVDLADALEPVLEDGPAVLYGHSLGGLVAVALAARRPERVGGLVLEDPPLFSSLPARLAGSSFERGFIALRTLLEGAGASYGLAEWEREVATWPSGHGRGTVAEVLGPDGVARRARQLAALDPRLLDTMLGEGVQDGFDMAAALEAVSCPAVLLAGEESRNSALTEDDRAFLAARTSISVEPVSGEGHFVHETLPEPCARAIVGVMAQRRATSRS